MKKSYYVSRKENPIYSKASFQLGVLRDMHIKLTAEEIDYLFSLPSEVAIENYCHRIIMERL